MATLQLNGPIIDHGSDWADFKKWLNGTYGALAFTWTESPEAYVVVAVDGPFFRTVGINKVDPASDDQADFEAAYKTQPLAPKEARTKDGRLVVRDSTANRTTNFKLRAVSFYTAELTEGFHNVNPVTGADYGDVTMRLFKADGSEITTEEDEILAVKTILDFEPHYNYEIIGGFLDIPSDLKDGVTDAWYISAVGVPDYPPEYFGQIDFISEVNIEAVTSARVTSDGRAVSFLPYNYGGMPHTNLLRFIIRHPVGVKKRFQLFIEHFV